MQKQQNDQKQPKIYHQKRDIQKIPKKSKRKTGYWTKQQQKKYIQFLSSSRKIFQSRQHRKTYKIFKQMSQFISSRDGIQCRSHHMKQLKIHKYVGKILSFYSQFNQETLPQFLNTNQFHSSHQFQQINFTTIPISHEFSDIKQNQYHYSVILPSFLYLPQSLIKYCQLFPLINTLYYQPMFPLQQNIF